MYTAFKHSHMLLAVLTFITAIAFLCMGYAQQIHRRTTLVYVLTRVFGGLAALTGLAVTFAGPWRHMMYPYMGLILYVVHGLSAGFAKRLLDKPSLGLRRSLLVVQLLALMALTGLMGAKPF